MFFLVPNKSEIRKSGSATESSLTNKLDISDEVSLISSLKGAAAIEGPGSGFSKTTGVNDAKVFSWCDITLSPAAFDVLGLYSLSFILKYKSQFQASNTHPY